MHPDTDLRFINEQVGHGVVATKDIPKGTITWVQDKLDREFSFQQVKSLGENYSDLLDRYCFRNQHGEWVLCWDHARFVNHSFRANCLTTAYNFEIAIRDIAAGEELTDDYGYLNISDPFEAMDEGTDRKIVYPDDLTRYHRIWDEQLQKTWKHIPGVNQPLQRMIDEDLWARIEQIAAGSEEMASILNCYFDEEKRANRRTIKSAPRARQRS
jgi:hypothetical protein